ncbi:MAG: hypothetical protein ACOX6D_02650 [Thermoguttaceae bacterium]|jgi:hypothetical protein
MKPMRSVVESLEKSLSVTADPKVAARATELRMRGRLKERQKVPREQIEGRWHHWHQQCLNLFSDKGLDPDPEAAFKLACFYADYRRWHAGETFGHRFDKPKGIFLYGPFGSGKTEVLKTLVVHLRETVKAKFLFRQSRSMIEDYCSLDRTLEYYRYTDHQSDVFLDDVGIESAGLRYGMPWSIGDYLKDRYDRCSEYGREGRKILFTTLVSSNFSSPREIKEKYGARTLSVLVDICDFVPYIHTDRRLGRLSERERRP